MRRRRKRPEPPGPSRAGSGPVSESTGALTCHHLTGASAVVKAVSAWRPRSMPEPPTINSRGRSSTIALAIPAPSSVATMMMFGSHPGSPARNPTSVATVETRSAIYSATSLRRLTTPTQTGRRHRATPRFRAGAATSSTKSRVRVSSRRPSTTMSSSRVGASWGPGSADWRDRARSAAPSSIVGLHRRRSGFASSTDHDARSSQSRERPRTAAQGCARPGKRPAGEGLLAPADRCSAGPQQARPPLVPARPTGRQDCVRCRPLP